jgi:hypothetical protein
MRLKVENQNMTRILCGIPCIIRARTAPPEDLVTQIPP